MKQQTAKSVAEVLGWIEVTAHHHGGWADTLEAAVERVRSWMMMNAHYGMETDLLADPPAALSSPAPGEGNAHTLPQTGLSG